MGLFLETWGKPLAGRVRILTYEQTLAYLPALPPRGAYIFTSIGPSLGSRSPPSPVRELAARLRRGLVERDGPASALNDSMTSLRRLALLRMLHERGINRFAAYRAGETPGPQRFPVFLREEHGAQWQATPLLKSRAEYAAALAREDRRDGLLAVEYCDTADAAGIYRKYGTFIVGERIVPRHLFFSGQWMVKSPDLIGPAQLAEELAYLESNPHAEALHEVCRLANIGYGRIDYALLDGRVQVWEINTTPTIVHPHAPEDAARHAIQQRFADLFSPALDALDSGALRDTSSKQRG